MSKVEVTDVEAVMLPKEILRVNVPTLVREQGIDISMELCRRYDAEEQNCKKYLLKKYKDFGIKILGESTTSNAMYQVELPEGWTISPKKDTPWWSYLYDDALRCVASIFFKDDNRGTMDRAHINFHM